MKHNVLGIEFRSGISKNTNQPYAMAIVHYIQPALDAYNSATFQQSTYGSTGVARNLQVNSIEDLEALKRKYSLIAFPAKAEFVTQEVNRGGKFESQLVDVVFDPVK